MDAFWKARGANIIRNNFYEIIKEFFSFTKKNQIVLRKALNVRCVQNIAVGTIWQLFNMENTR